MSLTPEEKQGIELGTISHVKRTETYKKAHAYYKSECEKLAKSGYELDRNTYIWFDENEMSMKMRFVTIADKNQGMSMEDIFKNFEDIFGKK